MIWMLVQMQMMNLMIWLLLVLCGDDKRKLKRYIFLIATKLTPNARG
jgi:hypothetical protein